MICSDRDSCFMHVYYVQERNSSLNRISIGTPIVKDIFNTACLVPMNV